MQIGKFNNFEQQVQNSSFKQEPKIQQYSNIPDYSDIPDIQNIPSANNSGKTASALLGLGMLGTTVLAGVALYKNKNNAKKLEEAISKLKNSEAKLKHTEEELKKATEKKVKENEKSEGFKDKLSNFTENFKEKFSDFKENLSEKFDNFKEKLRGNNVEEKKVKKSKKKNIKKQAKKLRKAAKSQNPIGRMIFKIRYGAAKILHPEIKKYNIKLSQLEKKKTVNKPENKAIQPKKEAKRKVSNKKLSLWGRIQLWRATRKIKNPSIDKEATRDVTEKNTIHTNKIKKQNKNGKTYYIKQNNDKNSK